MIFFGGILVEKFGYKKLLMIAFVLHLISAALLFSANPLFAGWRESDPETATAKVFNVLFWSAFLFSLCQGLYEAVINPLIAQLYPDSKTHYLNILHAGWPAGMIIGGLFAAGFIGENAWFVELPWQYAPSSFAIVVIAYGVMVIPERFPETVSESAGSMGKTFACFASIPFLVLIVIHAMIGYMELGVDSWMTKLMENLLPNSVIILVYTSMLMFGLRFFAGPIVHRINPIGLLFGSSIIACGGLLWLGSPIQSVFMIFVAATFYSFGKAFLWPTMLGVVGERYPQSGSVAMALWCRRHAVRRPNCWPPHRCSTGIQHVGKPATKCDADLRSLRVTRNDVQLELRLSTTRPGQTECRKRHRGGRRRRRRFHRCDRGCEVDSAS